MTKEEREALADTFLEQAAILDRNILPDQRGQAGKDYTFGIIKGLKEAAAIVRAHPVASPWIPVDRPPESGDTVLVVEVLGTKHLANPPSPGAPWRNLGGWLLQPTHWMSLDDLPEPPEDTEP